MVEPSRPMFLVPERIKASGVTLIWLCEQTGIPRSTMSRRMTHPEDFTLNEIGRIAQALRMSTMDLLSEQVPA